MSGATLVLRSLRHHASAWAAVALTCATACAIITGALLVGDSVRGSLRDRALERLSGVRQALVSGRFVRVELAEDVAAAAGSPVAPAILLRASVVHSTSKRRAQDVGLIGVDERFLEAVGATGWELSGRDAIINRALAEEIGAASAEDITVTFEEASDIDREQALGDRSDTTEALRVTVAVICEDAGPGLFDLRHQQETPRNVFVSLRTLQRALEQQGRANALLATDIDDDALAEALSRAWSLDDVGLTVRSDPERGYAALESREFLIGSAVVEAARGAARDIGAPRLESLTYLANRLRVGEREIPYSTVTAVGAWTWPDGRTEPPLESDLPAAAWEPGGVILNDWALADLGASPGSALEIGYYDVGPDHDLIERTARLELRGSVPLSGAAEDPGWTPPYPGVSDARTFADWEAPFPVDTTRIREPGPDGDYWSRYRTTPKAFLALEDGQRLWASRFGRLTSLRVRPEGGRSLEDTTAAFRSALRARLDPAGFGLFFRPVAAEATRAASSGTDFGMLFVSMSFFIILAALLLTGMTFRLAIERRARELGMLSALGWTPAQLTWQVLREAIVVTAVGSVIGLAAGAGYAGVLIFGLKTLWKDAVNAPFLTLHVAPTSLHAGFLATALLVLGTVWWVTRRLVRVSAVRLLAGDVEETEHPDEGSSRRGARGRWSLLVGTACIVTAGAFLLLALTGIVARAPAFFAQGGALLVGGLALFHAWLRRPTRSLVRGHGALALLRLGARNGRRAAGRSLLTAGLIACATFIVVVVAASRQDPTGNEPELDSGNGGFTLVARSTSPLFARLDTADGQEKLSLATRTVELLACEQSDGRVDRTEVHAFRERPGDETSCLNLYRPSEPRLLGAAPGFVRRGGFAWAGSLARSDEERANPWLLLERRPDDWPEDVVPAIGDQNTVLWILHAGLGDDVVVRDDTGAELRLRIVGLTTRSLFQGSLVIAEDVFLERFVDHPGWSTFLIATPEAATDGLVAGLEADLADYGFDARTAGEVLAAYQAVENTYLSTFLVLGGLGLLLGTVGLGATLLRNVQERRGELALLRALGYSRAALGGIVLSETLWLLVLGETLGAGSALLAVVPNVVATHAEVSWALLSATLSAVLVAGVLSCALALFRALSTPLLPALRGE